MPSALPKHFFIDVLKCLSWNQTMCFSCKDPCLDDAIDYFQFSKQINNQCSAQQRIDIVELLWRLAYADGELDPQEEYVIRRVANLLYVTHEDFIAAKLAATKL